MRRVKWVVMASRVAMLARRSWPNVDWMTEMRVVSLSAVLAVE